MFLLLLFLIYVLLYRLMKMERLYMIENIMLKVIVYINMVLMVGKVLLLFYYIIIIIIIFFVYL